MKWTAPGKGPQTERAKAAQRPVPQTEAGQLAQESLQPATLLPDMPMGRGPLSIITEWMTVGPVGCTMDSGGGLGRGTALRTRTVGFLRFHLRLAMVVPGAWWTSSAASWILAKTVWTTMAAAMWVALAATKPWQGL